MAEQDETQKNHEATPQKLEKAKKKGDVPKSTDLATVASYVGLLIVAWAGGTFSISELGNLGTIILESSDTLARAVFESSGSSGKPAQLLQVPASVAAIWLVPPMILVILTYIAQGSITFAPEKIQPKLSRVSPIQGFKNKFGADGFFGFFSSTLKLTLISIALTLYLIHRLPEILITTGQDNAIVIETLGSLCLEFLLVATGIISVIAIFDTLWQFTSFYRRNRMSDQELKEQAKESDGDPHFKQERRQRAQAIATSQMISDVDTASVIIVNPTHYSVALKWSHADKGAPICVAKGQDEVALRIRERANLAAIPIYSDPPTARALFATVQVGNQIEPEFYASVATAIRFAETISKKRFIK